MRRGGQEGPGGFDLEAGGVSGKKCFLGDLLPSALAWEGSDASVRSPAAERGSLCSRQALPRLRGVVASLLSGRLHAVGRFPLTLPIGCISWKRYRGCAGTKMLEAGSGSLSDAPRCF